MVDATWSNTNVDGTVLHASVINSAYDDVQNKIKYDVSTIDTTEYSETTNAYVTKKTFTFTPSSSRNQILWIKVSADLKILSLARCYVQVTINGHAIAPQFSSASGRPGGTYWVTLLDSTNTSYTTASAEQAGTLYSGWASSVSQYYPADTLPPASSYSIVWSLGNYNTGGTAYMKNLKVEVIYADNIKYTTNAGTFT